jgi:hypothetical protein
MKRLWNAVQSQAGSMCFHCTDGTQITWTRSWNHELKCACVNWKVFWPHECMPGGSQVIALQQSMSAQHRGQGWTLLHLRGMIIRNLQPRSWTYPVQGGNILQMHHSTLCILYCSWCSFIAGKGALRTEPISLQTTITVKWLAFRPHTRIRESPINIAVRGLVTSAVALSSFFSPSVQTRRRQSKLCQNRFLSHSL